MMKLNKINIPPNYLFASLLLSAVSWYFVPCLNIVNDSYNYYGWVLIILGMPLTGWVWKYFQEHDTPVDFAESRILVTNGPFRFSRNPMYVGMFLIALGTAICFKNLIGIVGSLLFILVINFMSIPFEEKKNERTFGQEFLEYKKKVRRWL